MPYQTMQSDFERVDGEITVDGKIYKYVKRRIVNGEMVLMCLPDHNKMQIQSAKDDFFKNTNDVAQDNTSQKSDHSKAGAFKNLLSDFDQQSSALCALQHFFNCPASFAHAISVILLSLPHTPPVPPPDAIIYVHNLTSLFWSLCGIYLSL